MQEGAITYNINHSGHCLCIIWSIENQKEIAGGKPSTCTINNIHLQTITKKCRNASAAGVFTPPRQKSLIILAKLSYADNHKPTNRSRMARCLSSQKKWIWSSSVLGEAKVKKIPWSLVSVHRNTRPSWQILCKNIWLRWRKAKNTSSISVRE